MTLAEYITSNLGRPFEWGALDCVLFAAHWARIKTGKDYLADMPKWSSEDEAERVIDSVGGLESAIDAMLPRVNPNLAKDGDVALFNGGLWLFSGPHIVGMGFEGIVHMNRRAAECAWSC